MLQVICQACLINAADRTAGKAKAQAVVSLGEVYPAATKNLHAGVDNIL